MIFPFIFFISFFCFFCFRSYVGGLWRTMRRPMLLNNVSFVLDPPRGPSLGLTSGSSPRRYRTFRDRNYSTLRSSRIFKKIPIRVAFSGCFASPSGAKIRFPASTSFLLPPMPSSLHLNNTERLFSIGINVNFISFFLSDRTKVLLPIARLDFKSKNT